MASQPITLTSTFVLFLLLTAVVSGGEQATNPPEKCFSSSDTCRDKPRSLKLKIIATASILAASAAGVCAPMAAAAARPGTSAFLSVKAFAAGVILATGYMHVLPDAFECLASECLPAAPWREFPFAAFVAMVSAVATLMVDSASMSYYRRIINVSDHEITEKVEELRVSNNDNENGVKRNVDGSELIRHRVVAQVLELGIVVHSVVIGLSLGASDNPCTIRPLIAALCFHQLFEGMGLGGCILQAKYGTKVKAIMVFFFAFTTPFGIALGIGLSNIYSDQSPTALIVVGLLNACSAGILNYTALVELLAADFLGPELQANVKLQMWCYACVLFGAGGMSLMAKWA